MRLIDADELKEELASHFDVELEPLVEKEVLRMIDEQETISVKPPKWVSVKDRLPEDDREVLAVSDGCVLIANWQGEWIKYIELEDDYTILEPVNINVQYWMELPKPPKED